MSSPFFFFKDLKFLSYRSFPCLVRVTPRYFILLVVIVRGSVPLISFSASLSFVCRRATDFFFLVNLVSSHFTFGVYQLQEFPDRIFGVT